MGYAAVFHSLFKGRKHREPLNGCIKKLQRAHRGSQYHLNMHILRAITTQRNLFASTVDADDVRREMRAALLLRSVCARRIQATYRRRIYDPRHSWHRRMYEMAFFADH